MDCCRAGRKEKSAGDFAGDLTMRGDSPTLAADARVFHL
jgi:hypothetical protein